MTEFNELLDAVDLDPRPRIKARVAAICEQQLVNMPAAVAENIARSRLRELGTRIRAALDNGRSFEAWTWISQFEIELRNAVISERKTGALKPVAPDTVGSPGTELEFAL